LGVLSIASVTEGAFAKADLTLLSQLANQVVLALDNADIFNRLSRLNERLIRGC
jgi:GAF domain-containing protein